MPPLKRLGWFLYVALFAVLVLGGARSLVDGGSVLNFRYELDYGEGIVWQQALLMTGPAAYGDITRYPYIVFHYPPLFHLAARSVAGLGVDGLVAGRLVSLTATFAIVMSMGALAWCAMPARLGRWGGVAAAATAATLPLSLQPIYEWAPLMRVDMLAMALSYAGMLLAVFAPHRRAVLSLGALLFVAAVFTKQTAVAGPAATFGVLLLAMPGHVFRAALPAAVVAITALAGLTWITDGGFLRHIIGYNINRFDIWAGLVLLGLFGAANAGLVLIGLAGVVLGGRDLIRQGSVLRRIRTCRSSRVSAVLIVHAIIATAMLPMIGKSGASINYLIEWSCAFALLAGLIVGRSLAALRTSAQRPHLALLVVPAMLMIQCYKSAPGFSAFDFQTSGVAELQRIEDELRADGRPVISDDLVLPLRAGIGIAWEPSIFAELGSLGRWDEAPLLAMIERQAFSMVLTVGGPGTQLYDSRYTPTVSDAIMRNYPRQQRIPGLVVRRPQE